MPDDISQAVAAVRDKAGRVCGTAFFVGPDVALTCDHVLRSGGSGPLSLRTVGSETAEPVISTVRDAGLDLAVLRVPHRDGRPVLRIEPDRLPPGRIGSHGFPNDQLAVFPHGCPMPRASHSGLVTAHWQNQDVTVLMINEKLAFGMSGAPAVDVETGAVVGILRFSQTDENRSLAVPMRVVVDRWPGLQVDPEAEPPSFGQVSPAVPEGMARTAWDRFQPSALHCVVVDSEFLSDRPGPERLSMLAGQTLRHWVAGPDVWAAFAAARREHVSVDGVQRDLSGGYRGQNIKCATFSVLDAFTNSESLDLAVRLLVEADLALFDVTRFEPGVMLLLGIRAATRRGVTIASHGAGWTEVDWQRPAVSDSGELTRLYRPFNLSDISLSSHTPQDPGSGDDPRIARFAERVCTGFAQLARQPFYRDLPVYDALRQLGADDAARSSIGLDSEVLVLCSYGESFYRTWNATLRPKLVDALHERDIRTRVYRLQDLFTPQVVSQALYERIRRCAACVADWTDSSPSTFFELGVRMTVSRWDVVQIARSDWMREQIENGSGALRQISLMNQLLEPLTYEDGDGSDVGVRVADRLVRLVERSGGSAGHPVRQRAAAALGVVEDKLPELHQQLRLEADALNRADEEQNIPQTLFYEVIHIKKDHERSATERRLAAWLYLEHRVEAALLPRSDSRRIEWQTLGTQVAVGLYRTSVEADAQLAQAIEKRIGDGARGSVELLRNRGDMLRRTGQEDKAEDAYLQAVAVVDAELAELSAAPGADPAQAKAIAEWLGNRGGLFRRLDDQEQALDSYREGARVEAAAALPSTYNRTNEIKLKIETGVRLAGLNDDLSALREVLERLVRTDERATDDAWVWADLGDVRLLLGDLTAAAEAYRAFADKAKSTSPASTLKVIREVVSALGRNEDPAAERLVDALARVEQALRGYHPTGW